jgi:hypothetical protein
MCYLRQSACFDAKAVADTYESSTAAPQSPA